MNPNKEIPFGRYFEDFGASAIYQHSVRNAIAGSGNNLFSLLTMNPHPVPLNQDYASYPLLATVLEAG